LARSWQLRKYEIFSNEKVSLILVLFVGFLRQSGYTSPDTHKIYHRNALFLTNITGIQHAFHTFSN
jgi:hypothetical protein